MRTESREIVVEYGSMEEFVEIFRQASDDVPLNARWELSNFQHGSNTSVATLKFWWPQQSGNGLFIDPAPSAREVREKIVAWIPNLAFTHEYTKFWVYREFKVLDNEIEYTVYYREPDKEKMRIDLTLKAKVFENLPHGFGGLGPEHFEITYWGEARKATI